MNSEAVYRLRLFQQTIAVFIKTNLCRLCMLVIRVCVWGGGHNVYSHMVLNGVGGDSVCGCK